MSRFKCAFQKPIVRVVFLLVCLLIALHLWKWYGPTPYRTLRLFLKALQEKNAEAIWELCGGNSLQSLFKAEKIGWNAFRLPPKENFFQFLDKLVFSQIPQRAAFSWELNPIMTGRFLWFQRHSSTLFYFTVKGPDNFWMPVLIQKVFGRWVIKPRTTFGGYLSGLIERKRKLPSGQAYLKAGQIWAQYGGAWKPGEPIGALGE